MSKIIPSIREHEREADKLSNHWRRNNIHNVGTGVFWNKHMGMWEVKITRHLGHYHTASEAAEVLDKHIDGVEEWFIREIEIVQRRLMLENRE